MLSRKSPLRINKAVQYKYPASQENIEWMGSAYISEEKARHPDAVGKLTFWANSNEKKTVEEGTYLIKIKSGYLAYVTPEVYKAAFEAISKMGGFIQIETSKISEEKSE
jgi:hypothetical protein